ncbi:MAG TPA: peptide MFS transporter [Acidobacteriota bacterium]|nr:peptide MFS transporter [Acidobacteriota bacterium]
MLKEHPKGLFVAFFANMGERFGFYTMLAIFVYYIQAKFGYTATQAGAVYGTFLFGIYFFPLLGGWLADRVIGYGKTITLGTVLMFLGYSLMALPGFGQAFLFIALGIICLGTGFFKGNLQALVGNLYDDPKYEKNRDFAFNIFYMGINVGAFFAPHAATGISNLIMEKSALTYNARIPALAHQFLDGALKDTSELLSLAKAQLGSSFTDLTSFSQTYIETLSKSYNAAFAITALSIVASFLIFVGFKKYYKHADLTEKQKEASEEYRDKMIHLTKKQTRDRLFALFFVFFVVIFFWMSFHQNGFTLSMFARDYTVSEVSNITYTFFNLKSFLPFLAAIIGLVLLVRKKNKISTKVIGLVLLIGGGFVTYAVVKGFNPTMSISPQLFQHFNPIFIVFLTPVVIGFFTFLQKRGKEPSTPKKIGIGMILTAFSFGIMMIASRALPSPADLQGSVSPMLISPYWLIATYFSVTIAELCLSPMGISFVSKVSPPRYKGTMQGGWLAATAIGNALAGFIGYFWDRWEIWQFFLLLIAVCFISAALIFSVMKKLERASES